jgi:hypothetical protein
MEQPPQSTHAREPEGRIEGCTAPHPAKAFLLALPAFAIVVAAVVLIWILL